MDIKTLIIIVSIPVISALIGWFTNYIAIKSLFRPLKKVNFLFFSFQGVIPKRKKLLASRIASVVEQYLFSHKDITALFEDKKNKAKIKKKILPIIEAKFLEKVPAMFRPIAEPILKKVLDEEIDELIHKISLELSEHTVDNIDIKKIVQDKLSNYDVSRIEKIIYSIASSELKHIEYLGAVIGFVVGCFQLFLFVFLN